MKRQTSSPSSGRVGTLKLARRASEVKSLAKGLRRKWRTIPQLLSGYSRYPGLLHCELEPWRKPMARVFFGDRLFVGGVHAVFVHCAVSSALDAAVVYSVSVMRQQTN